MEAIWQDKTKRPRFDTQLKNTKTDVLIIGGGITGILCAYMLEQSGVDYILVEADRICSGITKNTTAKITFQHGLIYQKLISRFGVEKARQYLEANRNAVEKYRTLCQNINCDFQEKNNYVYSTENRKKIEKELVALEKLGCNADYTETVLLPVPTVGAVCINRQAQFNPLKFLFSVAKDLKVIENVKVLELKRNKAVTNKGKISADKIISATHFPFINKHGCYFLKMYQHRSYVVALKNAGDINGMYVDENEKGLSFRNYGEYLLVGGGSHRTGKSGGSFPTLEEFYRANYPGGHEEYRWATQDCMTLDEVPYIGQYSAHTPNFYVATGFNKWGMSSAMAAADILTDMVLDRHNPYAEIFNPSRTIIRPQLAVNAAEAAIGLLKPSVHRCPHMGCALKYNRYEHSWDCSCHGSRFTNTGKLIDNPATDDKRK